MSRAGSEQTSSQTHNARRSDSKLKWLRNWLWTLTAFSLPNGSETARESGAGSFHLKLHLERERKVKQTPLRNRVTPKERGKLMLESSQVLRISSYRLATESSHHGVAPVNESSQTNAARDISSCIYLHSNPLRPCKNTSSC